MDYSNRVQVVPRQASLVRRDPKVRRLMAIAAAAVLLGAFSSAVTSAQSEAPASPAATAAAPIMPACMNTSPAATAEGSVTCETASPTIGNGKKQMAWAIGLHDLQVIQDIDHLMTARANSYGWEMLFDQGTAGNIGPMVASIQSWITQGVPAINVTSDDPSAVAPLQQQALDKGLIWTVYGTQDMPTNPHAFIGFPATEAGAKGAEDVVKYINTNAPNAEVLILTQVTNPGGKPREDLPAAAIEAETQATIVGNQDGGDQLLGLKATQTALTAHPNMRVVVSRTDAGALGAAQAFKNAGIPADEVYILTYDGSLESLVEMRDEGYIKTIIALDLEKLANAVVDTTIGLALSGPPAQEIQNIVATDVVTRDSPKLQELIDFYESEH
jgi:ABC-type sugar transport system substrate-binding protein